MKTLIEILKARRNKYAAIVQKEERYGVETFRSNAVKPKIAELDWVITLLESQVKAWKDELNKDFTP